MEVDGERIAIVESGSYRLTGTMTEGSLSVEADDVELIWDGAQTGLFHGRAADRARGPAPDAARKRQRHLSDLRRAGNSDDDGAAIVAGGEVAVSGEGTLTVVGQAGHGLRAAALRIEGGALSVLAGGDGAHLEAEEGEACFDARGRTAGGGGGRPRRLRGRRRAHRGGDLRLESERGRPLRGRRADLSGGAAQE